MFKWYPYGVLYHSNGWIFHWGLYICSCSWVSFFIINLFYGTYQKTRCFVDAFLSGIEKIPLPWNGLISNTSSWNKIVLFNLTNSLHGSVHFMFTFWCFQGEWNRNIYLRYVKGNICVISHFLGKDSSLHVQACNCFSMYLFLCIKSIFRTLPDIHDGTFWRKYLMTKSRLFLKKKPS